MLMALLLFLWLGSNAQNTIKMELQNDTIETITAILENRYFKGIYTGDVALLRTVYYPGTLLFGDVKGESYAKTLDAYLDGVAHRQSPQVSGTTFEGKVNDIRVINSIAIADVTVTMYSFVYREFLSFHKIDGQWVLVHKMISDVADQDRETIVSNRKN